MEGSHFPVSKLTTKAAVMKIATKENIDKLDFIKIKNICNSKDTVKRMKGKLTEWDKHFCISYL